MPGIPHDREHRRIESTCDHRRTVSWKCRYCERITTWTLPASVRAYKYRVCGWCCARSWAERIGTRVMTEDELDQAVIRKSCAESDERHPIEEVFASLGLGGLLQ